VIRLSDHAELLRGDGAARAGDAAELKQLEEEPPQVRSQHNHDLEQFGLCTLSDWRQQRRGGHHRIAQGQFPVDDVVANFRKQRSRRVVRTNRVFPLGNTGMSVAFLDESTMVFGGFSAVKQALDVRDGWLPACLTNNGVMDSMRTVDNEPLWSVLDTKGTQP